LSVLGSCRGLLLIIVVLFTLVLCRFPGPLSGLAK